MALRRAEDARRLALLGARTCAASRCRRRRTAATTRGRAVRRRPVTTTGSTRCSPTSFAAICARERPDIVFGPQGLGNHVDHRQVIARDARGGPGAGRLVSRCAVCHSRARRVTRPAHRGRGAHGSRSRAELSAASLPPAPTRRRSAFSSVAQAALARALRAFARRRGRRRARRALSGRGQRGRTALAGSLTSLPCTAR